MLILYCFIADSTFEVHVWYGFGTFIWQHIRIRYRHVSPGSVHSGDSAAPLLCPHLSIPPDSDGGAARAEVVHHVDRRLLEHEVALLEGDPPVAVDIGR